MNQPGQIETKPFKLQPSLAVKIETIRWVGRWWPLLAMLPLATAVGGFYDTRFFILALLMALVIVPHIIVMVYFTRLLSVDIPGLMQQRKIELSIGEKIVVSLYSGGDDSLSESVQKVDTYEWQNIRGIHNICGCFVVSFRNDRKVIVLPENEIINQNHIPLILNQSSGMTWSDQS